MPLRLTITAESGKAFAPFLRRQLRRAVKLVRSCALRELDVALVGELRMKQVHQEFLGINKPTDVLSFAIEQGCGEIVICVPVARKQAKTLGIPVQSELLLYCIHGMLHLCGFDDRTDSEFQKMHRTEDAILTKLGFGPVFAPPAGAKR